MVGGNNYPIKNDAFFSCRRHFTVDLYYTLYYTLQLLDSVGTSAGLTFFSEPLSSTASRLHSFQITTSPTGTQKGGDSQASPVCDLPAVASQAPVAYLQHLDRQQ